jgi:hypothetical protein
MKTQTHSIMRRSIQITEEPGGWRIDETLYATASEAIRAVASLDQSLCDVTGETVVTKLLWVTNTRIGGQIVRVLAGF